MKISVMAAVALCLSWTSLLQADPAQDAEEAKLRRLVSRLPKIDTNNVACPPFDARFHWKADDGGFHVHLRFQRPARLDATMTDAADGAPCILYRDETVMFFDPATPQFVVAPETRLDFGYREGDDGKVAFGARVGFGSEHVQRVQIDLQQVMRAGGGVLTDEGSTESVIRLRQQRGDTRDELELRLTEPPVCVVTVLEGDDPEPVMTMTMTVFGSDASPLFNSPDLGELAKVMPVDQPGRHRKFTDGILGFTAGMKVIGLGYYTLYSHIGSRQPGVREEFKVPGFSPPNWETVARHKQELGPKLRELCGLACPPAEGDDRPLTPMLAEDEDEATVRE